MTLGVHYINGRRLQRRVHLYWLPVLPAQVEHHALAVGVILRRGHVKRGEARARRAPCAASLPTQVGHHHWRERRIGHVATEVEARARHLVVATCGAVETVVRVFLQRVEAVVGGYVGRICNQSGAGLVVLLHENELFAPVAGDVAHERRAHGTARMDGPVALARELNEARSVVLGHVDVGATAAAAARGNQFALQVAIPPHGLHGVGGFPFLYHVALAIVKVAHGREHLVALVCRVYVDAPPAPHVADGRQVPLFDVLAGGGIVEQLPHQVGLLYCVDLEPGPVGVYVAHVVAVAVAYSGRHDEPLDRVDCIAAAELLVDAVAIDVGHAQLVELCGRRIGAAHGPRVGVMPVLGLAARPVKRPLAHVVMVAVALSAIHTLNCKRRVYAIEVAYRERTSEESILQSVVVVSIVGPVVAPYLSAPSVTAE